jgi:hypothetical protein
VEHTALAPFRDAPWRFGLTALLQLIASPLIAGAVCRGADASAYDTVM